MNVAPIEENESLNNRHEGVKKVAHKGFKIFAKIGYISKGTVYIIAGFLSFLASLGTGEKPAGTEGVLIKLANTPYGPILLWVIAVGLCGYVSWRVYQILFIDKDDKNVMKVFFMRIGYFISGGVYAILGYKAAKFAMNLRGEEITRESMTSMLLQQTYGEWLVGLIGMVIIGVGVYEFYSSFRGKFIRRLNTSQMGKEEYTLGKKAGKYGLRARSFVLFIIGYFFLQAALTMNSDNAIGMDGALLKIAQQPYGKWLLGVVSGGLILYGLFEIIKGKNHSISDF